MQGKGFVKLLLVILILLSLLQVAYIIPTNRVEKKADKIAQEHVSKYLDSMSSVTIFSIPLLSDFTYNDLKKKQLALGLDLKGGQSVVLQVDTKKLISDLANNSQDPTFLTALDNAQAALASSQSDFVGLLGSEWQKVAGEKKLGRFFISNASLREAGLNTQSGDGEVIRILRDVTKDVVSLTFNRLKQRIDKMGVVQPNITLDDARDIILVELPGIDNPERAREFLQASAKLEFWDIFRANDPVVSGALFQADEVLKASLGLENNGPKFETVFEPVYDDLGNLIDSTEKQVEINDPFGNQGPLFKMLQYNQNAPFAELGNVNRNQTDEVLELLNRNEVKALFPSNSKFLMSAKPSQIDGKYTENYQLYLVKARPGSTEAPMEGDVVLQSLLITRSFLPQA